MSIDSLYEGVVRALTTQGRIETVSQHLLCLKHVNAKVLYVYRLLEGLKAFPRILKVAKCERISNQYRNLGNQRFQQSDDYRAWQYYNLSLLYAPSDSDCFSIALSNRSAVFFSLGKLDECVKDIDCVFSLKYPEKLKDKLQKRKTTCKDRLQKNITNNSNPEYSFLSLMDPQCPRFPCASSKLEVVFNKDMGRHVVAKADIRVGEVLVQEEPYFPLLLKSQTLFSCTYCLSRSLNLLPCENCCFTLYCSIECKEKAWREYHEVECPLLPTLIEMEFTKLELLALRTVIKSRTDHPTWDSLFKTIKETELYDKTEFRGHVQINGEWVYDSKYYPSIHTLESNLEKRSVSDIFLKAVTAAVFLWLLQNKTTFLESKNEEEKEDIRKYTAGTLLHHVMTSPTNMHGLCTNVETSEGNFVEEFSIASAPYAFHSLLNHSCAPNVVRFGKLGTATMSLFALRPIKKGMQLFDNYGSHHALQDRESRRATLKFQYKFTCLCEACVDDWPTYLNMRGAKNVPAKLIKRKDSLLDPDALEKLQKADTVTAERVFRPLCELAGALEPYAPCIELADCQETLKQCLTIFRGIVPYGYSNLVDWSPTPP